MSTTGPMTEGTVKRVLVALWRRGAAGAEMTMRELLQETLAPLPDVQEALVILRRRRCLIEQSPIGVRLVSTGLACWQDVLEHVAREKMLRVARRVKVFARTGSTNDVAWQFAGSEEADGLVVVADEQTAGRGRLGHAWSSRAEQSILFSVLLKEREGDEVERLTLLAGLAAAQAVELGVKKAGGGIHVQIKWPNDLLIEGKKLAGILVERRAGFVVIGVGINVAQGGGDFPPEVAGRATSVYQATGMQLDRLRIVAELIERIDDLCGNVTHGDAWLAEWKSRCGMLGTRISVQSGGKKIAGQVVDVDPLKGLMLRDQTGATLFLSSQTTTLAG